MSENLVVPAQQLVSIQILLPVLATAKVMLGRSWCKLSPPFVTDRSQPVIIKGVSGRVGSARATAGAGGGGEVDNT